MELLSCTIMPYPWGSRTAIANLMGRPAPSPGPEAELWMGAHPIAPSTLAETGRPLDAMIADDPVRELGAETVRAFGPRLPFLLKILAAAEPLSLQAHPTAARAEKGFADEEARGVPRSASHRNYKDPSHKPELIVALSPFEALSGFRAPKEILAVFDAVAVAEIAPILRPLRASPDARGLAETFRLLMTTGDHALVDATVAACAADTAEQRLVRRLAKLYPGDVGIVSSLFLTHVVLEPGQGIYLDAGNLHAYVEGTGVELMASSDNVLRGGLTKKHVDVPELLAVLDFDAAPPKILRPTEPRGHEMVYETPAREFRLSCVDFDRRIDLQTRGPEILFTLAPVVLDGSAIPGARAVFVPASTGQYALAPRGPRAVLFRATTNL